MDMGDVGNLVTITFPPGTEYMKGFPTLPKDVGKIISVDLGKKTCRLFDSRGNTLEVPQEWCEVWTITPPAILNTGLRG
jgi:hypothetical protein